MQSPQISVRETAPFSPFAPFWMHALAFVIDALMLIAVLAVPFLVAPDFALMLAPGALWWQLLLALAYFSAMNGPIGRGQTFGKMAVDIRTVRADGRLLTWGEAAGRSAVQLAPFALIFAVTDLLATVPGETVSIAMLHARSLGVQTGLALLAMLMSCLLLSPRLRSYHDRVGDTFTGRQPIGDLFGEAITAEDDERAQLERRALMTGFFIGVVVIGMAGCDMAQNARSYGSDIAVNRMDYRAEMEQMASIADVTPALLWAGGEGPSDFGRTKDGVTTLTLGLYYTTRGRMPAEVVDGLAPLGAERVASAIGEDPERLRSVVLLGPNPDGADLPPVELKDWQYRSVLATAREVYPIFGYEIPLTIREAGRARIAVRLPPDEMIELKEPPESASSTSSNPQAAQPASDESGDAGTEPPHESADDAANADIGS